MTDITNIVWDKLISNIDEMILIERFSNEHQIKYSESEIDTSKTWNSHEIDVFVVKDGKTTSTTIDPSEEKSIETSIINVLSILKKIKPNPLYKGIVEGPFQYKTIENMFDPKFDQFIEESPAIVNQSIENCLHAGAKRAAGILFFGKETVNLRSSKGPEGSYSHTYWEFNIRGMQEDTDATGFGQKAGAMVSEADKLILEAGKSAGTFSKQMKDAPMGKPGTYDIIFSPFSAGQVIDALPSMANPLAILFGTSGLGDRMGDQLAPEFLTVTDEGRRPDTLVAKPFDMEGYPTQTTPLIEKGTLVNFIHNTSSAEMYQAKTTGNSYLMSIGSGGKILGPGNHTRVFTGGNYSFEELVEIETQNPILYITNSWYMRYTNSIEGIFSVIPRDGMFIIDQSGNFSPVKKLRLSDNLYRIMKNIQGMEKDSERQLANWWDEVNNVVLSHIRVADCKMTAATK